MSLWTHQGPFPRRPGGWDIADGAVSTIESDCTDKSDSTGEPVTEGWTDSPSAPPGLGAADRKGSNTYRQSGIALTPGRFLGLYTYQFERANYEPERAGIPWSGADTGNF